MAKKSFIICVVLIAILSLIFLLLKFKNKPTQTNIDPQKTTTQNENSTAHPLALSVMRSKNYPGSDLKTEQTLYGSANYKRYIVSYLSEGLKIYALMDVPMGQKPTGGWPVIVFNHGYIPPDQYRTTERYLAYTDAFARSGYIVIKSDYRGNGSSEGEPEGAYYSPAYATDVLNEISSIKKYPDANSAKIGMWGHSMGGNITLRDLEISNDIKAAVIWGGVVGSYSDLMNNWQRKVTYRPSTRELALRNRNRQDLVKLYGTPDSNPTFWNTIDPFYNVNLINAPIQLHQGLNDEEVPPLFSDNLEKQLKANDKTVEYFTYPGADHNISSPSFEIAIERSISFFNKYLK